jgi:chaperonin GroES
MKILGERLLVKPVLTPVKSDGGIYLPEQKKTYEAEIRSIGDEVKGFKPGQRVIFDKFAGAEVEVEDEKLLLLNLKDILARIDQ